MILGGVAVLAGATLARTGNKHKQNLALLAGGISLAAMSVRGVNEGLNNIELSKLVPNSHVLNNNFQIPTGLHVKKWMTVYVKNPYKIPYLSNVILNYELDGKQESVILPLREMHLKGTTFQSKYEDMLEKKKRQNGNWSSY